MHWCGWCGFSESILCSRCFFSSSFSLSPSLPALLSPPPPSLPPLPPSLPLPLLSLPLFLSLSLPLLPLPLSPSPCLSLPLPPSLPLPLPPQLNEEDIEGTFGGSDSRSRGYYSSVYTSSANAYMLMYRRIDKERNKGEGEGEGGKEGRGGKEGG